MQVAMDLLSDLQQLLRPHQLLLVNALFGEIVYGLRAGILADEMSEICFCRQEVDVNRIEE